MIARAFGIASYAIREGWKCGNRTRLKIRRRTSASATMNIQSVYQEIVAVLESPLKTQVALLMAIVVPVLILVLGSHAT